MAKIMFSARWLLVGLLGFGLLLSPDATYGQVQASTGLEFRIGILRSQGRLQEALRLAKTVVTLREHEFGANHPIFGLALINLASLYRQQGRYDEAKELEARAATIRSKYAQ